MKQTEYYVRSNGGTQKFRANVTMHASQQRRDLLTTSAPKWSENVLISWQKHNINKLEIWYNSGSALFRRVWVCASANTCAEWQGCIDNTTESIRASATEMRRISIGITLSLFDEATESENELEIVWVRRKRWFGKHMWRASWWVLFMEIENNITESCDYYSIANSWKKKNKSSETIVRLDSLSMLILDCRFEARRKNPRLQRTRKRSNDSNFKHWIYHGFRLNNNDDMSDWNGNLRVLPLIFHSISANKNKGNENYKNATDKLWGTNMLKNDETPWRSKNEI